jgi:tetratricopeptide (TPR) repeat protein
MAMRRAYGRWLGIVGAGLCLSAMPLEASPASRQLTAGALLDAYNLEFSACYARLDEAARLDPVDPAPVRAIAAVTWMEILFSQGAATFEAFTGQASKKDVVRPVPPLPLTSRFRSQIARALQLAEAQLARAGDADAHYQMGATTALSAIYYATVEGRTTGGLGEGRRAVKEMELARKLAPGRHETGLVLGISEYTISTLSFGYRFLAGIVGLPGNRAEALRRLEEAALPGVETEADALLVLMVVHNREGNRAQAAEQLTRLQSRFPRNRLLWLNAAATAIEARQFETAERQLAEGLAARAVEAPPAVMGEHALWLLKRGTARAALGRAADAVADLTNVLVTRPRDWVRARAHVELARLAIARQAVAEARRELDLAVEFGVRGGDGDAVDTARGLLKQTQRK